MFSVQTLEAYIRMEEAYQHASNTVQELRVQKRLKELEDAARTIRFVNIRSTQKQRKQLAQKLSTRKSRQSDGSKT